MQLLRRSCNQVRVHIGFGALMLALALLLSQAPAAHAQFNLPSGSLGGSGIDLILSPRSPAPGQTVTVTAQSYSIDLDRSTITWRVNGDVVGTGAGQKTISVSLPSNGSPAVVSVRATTQSGTAFNESLTIRPASVDLVYEADSYTPPFYKGRGLSGVGGTVTVIAIANIYDESGNLIPPSDLVYTWKQGSRVLGNSSGRGRDSVRVGGYLFFKTLDIRVEVEPLDQNVRADNRILIPSVRPFVLLYENHPTEGVRYEEAIGSSITLNADEVSIVAEPYHFGARTRTDADLSYEWRINNEPVDNPNLAKGVLTLRPQGAGGRANISAILEHAEHMLQQGRVGFEINFSGAQSSPF